jgi:hypothetical protein
LIAIGFIFCCTAVAWFTLGGTVVSRTGESDERLAREVEQLWGGRHNQVAPDAWVERPTQVTEDVEEVGKDGRKLTRQVTRTVIQRGVVALDSSQVEVELHLDPRRKGLLWYDTYAVGLRAHYRLRNPDALERRLGVHLAFPSSTALYDAFRFRVNGIDAPPVDDLSKGLEHVVDVPAHGEAAIEIGYRSRGMGPWTYAFSAGGVSQVRNFALELTTDFRAVDFPAGTLSPSTKTPTGNGQKLRWAFESLVTGQNVGVDPPDRLNPGPFAARVTFFAPVSLLFFFTVLVIVGALRRRNLHPMNYFFLAAAFFAFHLLLAYLVDHVNVHLAFAIAAATSLFLVASYLRLVAGVRFALVEAGLAQVVFLVLFSYAFFFEGYTGLTVTVGAVLTLFVLMQLTGRTDWEALMKKPDARA